MNNTVGQIVLRDALPKDMLHHLDKPLDAKGLRGLFNDLADKHPDSYKDIVSKMTRLGFETSTRMGSSVSLEDLRSPIDKDEAFRVVDKDIAAINSGAGTKKEKDNKKATTYLAFMDKMNKDVLDAGLRGNKTLAKIILSGSRGSPTQYRQTVAAMGIVPGPDTKPLVDFPINRSFAEGLSTSDYLAHSFGTRQGLVGTKLSIADSGYLSKQLFRSSVTIKVEENDCGTHKGIPVSVGNKDYIGSFLAMPAGTYKYDNEVTLQMLKDLRDQKIEDIVVRSPITCESNKHFHHGAVCQLCVGRRDKKYLPPIGDFIGVTAGTTLGEKMSQMTLGSKHTGSTVKKQTIGGVPLVKQFLNIPDTFRDKAPLANQDGKVTAINKPSQGGHEIVITPIKGKAETHYVGPGFELKFKVGDHVEAGDVLSDGIPNPYDVVKLKGIGEGRMYLSKALKNTFDEAGLTVNHRNFDTVVRNSIDHVRITHPDGLGNYLPNQVVSYNNLEKDYQHRDTAKHIRVGDAKGMFLEEPVLHYTIGTPITSSVVKELMKHKTDAVLAHHEKPGFEPEMQRMLDIPAHEEDWMHQLYSTYVQKRFLDAVNKGMKSDLYGASPISGLAAGTIGEKRAGTAPLGCLIAYTPVKDAERIITWAEKYIPEDQLTGDGRERENHVTVLYGFDASITDDDIQEFLKERPPVTFQLGKLGRFSKDTEDVIMIEVTSPDLTKLNADLKEHFKDKVTVTCKDYNPHMTLAYVKKDALKTLDGNSRFEFETYICDELIYSSPNGETKTTIELMTKNKKAYELMNIVD